MSDYIAGLREWGEHTGARMFPAMEWKDTFRVPLSAYPPVDFLPYEVPIVYTTRVANEMPLYSTVLLENHVDDERNARKMVLIGSVPDCPDMLFLFDQDTGAVVSLDTQEPAPQFVNSTLRDFVEFLYRFSSCFADGPGGTERFGELPEELSRNDPAAFEEKSSWWPMIFNEVMLVGE
ncbi:SUKH-4 family immunity protein [Nocardia sp. NPDC057663]|uniref:SUKH-4 family immunity protein n=1 Tax=Nocardia sp. NPDC057663 TaxID=3346201 RepID=UPI00366FDE75